MNAHATSIGGRLAAVRDALGRRDYAAAAELASTIDTGAEPVEAGPVGQRIARILEDRDHDAGSRPADHEARRRTAP